MTIQLWVEHNGREIFVRNAENEQEAQRWLSMSGPDVHFCRTVIEGQHEVQSR